MSLTPSFFHTAPPKNILAIGGIIDRKVPHEQALGDGFAQCFGTVAHLDAGEQRRAGRLPSNSALTCWLKVVNSEWPKMMALIWPASFFSRL